MYLQYYRLTQNPFQINTDPGFLWFGESQKEALATLQYAVLGNKSFMLLTGDVGVGKTTIVNAFLEEFNREDLSAVIHDPVLDTLDFFNFVAESFGIPGNFKTKGAFLSAFHKFLLNNYYKGKRVVLIIDECQLLAHALLTEIRLFSNFEKKGNKLINIFFVGQLEFNNILLRPENKAIRQRIAVNYNIPPLSFKETAKYIEYRLAVAGATRKIFEASAIRKIYHFSKGYPRLINIIADRALLTGYVKSAKRIKKNIIKECAKELEILEVHQSGLAENETETDETNDFPQVSPKTKAEEVVEKLEAIDGKTFRRKLDALNLKRSSNIRLALMRIHREASGPYELMLAIESESSNLISKEDVAEIDKIRNKIDDDSLKPLLDMLREQFN